MGSRYLWEPYFPLKKYSIISLMTCPDFITFLTNSFCCSRLRNVYLKLGHHVSDMFVRKFVKFAYSNFNHSSNIYIYFFIVDSEVFQLLKLLTCKAGSRVTLFLHVIMFSYRKAGEKCLNFVVLTLVWVTASPSID